MSACVCARGARARACVCHSRLKPHRHPTLSRRFADLLKAHYFDGCRFHRVVPGFIIQWGIPGDPQLYAQWGDNKIRDDPVVVNNAKGTIAFATSEPNARGSQMFVNLADNSSSLDGQGFAPFAIVVEGFENFDRVHAGYASRGPDQAMAKTHGNAYLTRDFPNLSFIKSATII